MKSSIQFEKVITIKIEIVTFFECLYSKGKALALRVLHISNDISIRKTLGSPVHVHCVGKLSYSQGFLSDKKQSELRTSFKFARLYFLVAVSFLFMRSTLYCHCMEGYTCPYRI